MLPGLTRRTSSGITHWNLISLLTRLSERKLPSGSDADVISAQNSWFVSRSGIRVWPLVWLKPDATEHQITRAPNNAIRLKERPRAKTTRSPAGRWRAVPIAADGRPDRQPAA